MSQGHSNQISIPSGASGTVLQGAGVSVVPVYSTATYPIDAAIGDLIYGSATHTYSQLAIGTYYGGQLINNDSGLPDWFTPRNYVFLYDEFIGQGGAAGSLNWGNATANGGSIAVQNGTSGNIVGWVNIFTGGATNGSSFLQNQSIYVLGNGFLSSTFYAQIGSLSNVTDRFTIAIGLSSGSSGINPSDGCWFQYSDNVNSGNWTIVTSSGSVQTTANTSTAADTNFHRFNIQVNAAGTAVHFYIDGTEVANSPITTHIPTSSGIGPWAGIAKSAGTNSKNLFIDYYTLYIKLTSARS